MFKQVKKNSLTRDGIKYCNPTYLRMSLHQELSRPMGDTTRWEKIFQRLNLLNLYYPYEPKTKTIEKEIPETSKNLEFYKKMKKFIIEYKYPICGDYAMYLYSRKSKYQKIKTFMKEKNIYKMGIYTENISELKKQINEEFVEAELKYHDINYKYMKNFYTLEYNGHVFMHIYQTNSCISYNDVVYRKQNYKVLSIDSILSLYFGLIVTDHDTLNINNLYIYCFILYSIIQKKYDIETPILKRFNLPCIGTHENFEDIKKERNQKFNKLKVNKKSKEYQEWFLQYNPKKSLTMKLKSKSKTKSNSKTKTKKN